MQAYFPVFNFKKIQCNCCSFAHNSQLSVHRRSHTDERPFKCDLCDKSYRQKTQVLRRPIVVVSITSTVYL